MTISKRLTSVIALMLALVCFLTACGGPAGKIVQTKTERIFYEEGEKIDPPPGLEELKILLETLPNAVPYKGEDGNFAYKIVYSASASREVEGVVKDLRTAMNRGLKTSVSAVLDTNEDSGYEILIGKTNRAPSTEAVNEVKSNRDNCYQDFVLKVEGNKIIITGYSDQGTINGVTWFMNTFCESQSTWNYVREDYEFLYAPSYNLPNITLAGKSIANYEIVYPKNMQFVYGRAVDDLKDYLISDFNIELSTEDERFAKNTNAILIGDINCAASNSVIPAANEYVIRQVGTKLVIKASDAVTLYYGVKAFNKLISDAKTSGKSLSIKDGYELRGTVDYSKDNVFKLTLNDEFDGDTVNKNLWSTYTASTYTSVLGGSYLQKGVDIAYQEDGVLHMPSYVKGKDFWVSELTTKNSVWYKYGCLEVRAKLPVNPAVATIWINGDYAGVNPEIDLLENFGNIKGFSANIHKWFREPTWDGTTQWAHTSLDGSAYMDQKRFTYNADKFKDDLTSDFHIYSLDWTEDYFRFAVDGVTFFKYNFSDNPGEVDSFRQKLYLIMGCGVGAGSYGPKYDASKHGTEFDYAVDYVRLYQIPEVSELAYGYKG